MIRFDKNRYEVLNINDYTKLIPELRTAMNVSQEDFAKLLGVAAVSISRWENGHVKPTKIIKVKLDKLFKRYDIKAEEEQNRHTIEYLTEDELEIYDLLLVKGKSLNKDELQKVKLAAKNLYKKLVDNRDSLFVIDWFKDENTTLNLKRVVSDSLDADLPDSYDKELFQSKTNLLMSVFIDKAVQGMRVA